MLLMCVFGLLGLTSFSQLVASADVVGDTPSLTSSWSSSPTSSWSSPSGAATDWQPRPLSRPLPQASYTPPHPPSDFLPDTVTYTTYAFRPVPTDKSGDNDGPFEQSAYNALWAKLSYSAEPPFTTTMSPTPVASWELVSPPPLPVQPLEDDPSLAFPPEFVWGLGTSAWQMEGGLQVEGRGPSVLDIFGAVGSPMAGTDANTATMHYFMYKQE